MFGILRASYRAPLKVGPNLRGALGMRSRRRQTGPCACMHRCRFLFFSPSGGVEAARRKKALHLRLDRACDRISPPLSCSWRAKKSWGGGMWERWGHGGWGGEGAAK